MKTKDVKLIDVYEWDALVKTTFGRPYSFQQQDGCKDRGTVGLSVPHADADEYPRDEVPEVVNHKTMGVRLAAWLKRDPKAPIEGKVDWHVDLWWARNFYPSLQAVANELHSRGLLPAGEYLIDIDW